MRRDGEILGVGRVLCVLAAMLAIGLGAAGPAAAQARFFGKTSRGGDVEFFSSGQRAVAARVSWRVRCRGVRYADTSGLPVPKHAARGGEFAAVEAYDLEAAPAGHAVEIEAAITGRRHFDHRRPGAEQWSGRFELEVVVRELERGRVVGRCRPRAMRWRVWREAFGSGRWTMTGEPGDWILDDDTVSYDSTNSELVAYGDDRHVFFSVDGRDGSYWDAEFAVPEGSRLRRGARFVKVEEDAPGGTGYLNVSGSHRSCNDSVGEFTVTAARFDRRRRMRAITITFEQRCGAAVRGTLSWRSRLR